MSNSILTWDDIDENSPLKDVADKDIAVKAAESLNALNTQEAEKEIEASRVALQQKTTQTPVLDTSDVEAKARASINGIDELLEAGGRVTVGDKKLLNAQSDLNQLVPFKYEWTWQLYLKGTEQHWMVSELYLDRAAKLIKDTNDEKALQLITNFTRSYRHRLIALPDMMLLNVYRLVTNPECRQYLLRQLFESCALRHAVGDLAELFGLLDALPSVSLMERARMFELATPYLRRNTSTTQEIADIQELLKELICTYGYMNKVYNIPALYLLLNYTRQHTGLSNVTQLVEFLIRDIQTQTAFAKKFLTTAFTENPQAFTDAFKTRITSAFAIFLNADMGYIAKDLNLPEGEAMDLLNLSRYFTTEFLNAIGVSDEPVTPPPASARWFVELFNQLTPDLSEGSSSGGVLGW